MTARRAVAAAFWSYSLANFKALYGRGGKGFTKDFLQVKAEVRDGINDLVGFDGNPINLFIKWPGDQLEARWDNKGRNGQAASFDDDEDDDAEEDIDGNAEDQKTARDERGQLKVRVGSGTSRKTVAPWQVGDPAGGVTAIQGDPNAAVADAIAEYDKIVAAGTRPWLVAVFLEGERRVLHARSYLTNPPAGLEGFGVDTLPPVIKDAILMANAKDLRSPKQKMVASGFVNLVPAARAEGIVAAIDAAFQHSPNVLVVGPPGCGKTVALEDLARRHKDSVWFDPERVTDAWSVDGQSMLIQQAFSPSYSYAQFVIGLRPQGGGQLELVPRPGPLLNLAHWCADGQRDGLLLVDEFNRGPAGAIFGDTLTLLDGEKRSSVDSSGSPITRAYADDDALVPPSFAARDGDRNVPELIVLPGSLKIVGAYNSTDRSVAPLDMALIRRFVEVRVGPDPLVLAKHLGIKELMANVAIVRTEAETSSYEAEDVRRMAVELLTVLNERILTTLGEDFQLGHALFWAIKGSTRDEVVRSLSEVFKDQIKPALDKAYVGKSEILAGVLNASPDDDDEDEGVGRWIAPKNRGLQNMPPRFAIHDLTVFAPEEQIRRLRHVILD